MPPRLYAVADEQLAELSLLALRIPPDRGHRSAVMADSIPP
jgi:hypothetical protein